MPAMSSASSASAGRPPDPRPLCPAGDLLHDWLARSRTTREAFADRIGVARETLYCWMVGENPPKLVHAARIEEITGIPAKTWAEV